MHTKSDYPLTIIKQTPRTIEKHLSQLSSDEEIFNESASFYEDKLKRSGYQQKLKSTLLIPKFTTNITTKEIFNGLIPLLIKMYPQKLAHLQLHQTHEDNN